MYRDKGGAEEKPLKAGGDLGKQWVHEASGLAILHVDSPDDVLRETPMCAASPSS